MKYKAIILNTETDYECERFTPQCLSDIAQSGRVIPVVSDFETHNKIGDAYKVEFDGHNIVCNIETDKVIHHKLVPVAAFISQEYHTEDDVKVYDKVELCSVSFTGNPVTPNTSLESLENDKGD